MELTPRSVFPAPKSVVAAGGRAPVPGITARLAVSAALALMGAAAQGATAFPLDRGNSVVGEVRTITAKHQDTLLAIAEEFELGYEELVAANPKLDSWLPGEGSSVVLPSRFIVPRGIGEGIYINLAEYRLYYLPPKSSEEEGGTVLTYPISIGRGDWSTPVGKARVTHKVIKPAWYPPESIRDEHAAAGDPLPKIVPPGPDNPLGDYALKLNLPGYLIHGTNRPYGIGMKATHGCIRLRPPNIADLFKLVSVETPVRIDWQPFKVGVKDGVIYFEAHPARSEVEEILQGKSADDKEQRAAALTASIREVLELTDETGIKVDWLRFAEIVREERGIPLPISLADAAADTGAVPVRRRSTPSATQQAEAYLF